MPYTNADDTKLPEYVQSLGRSRRARWVDVWNSVFDRTEDEKQAFAAANGMLRRAVAKAIGEDTVSVAALEAVHALCHLQADDGLLKSEAGELVTLHAATVKALTARGVPHPERVLERDAYSLEVAKAEGDKRYTFGVVYKPGVADAHQEWANADDLQGAQWDYVRRGNRSLYMQHGLLPHVGFKKAGEWVDIVSWPYEVSVTLKAAGEEGVERTIPADSIWMGAVWEPWAWRLIKDGHIRGFSFGGTARRFKE